MVRAFLGLAIVACVLASGCFAATPAPRTGSVTSANPQNANAPSTYPPLERDATIQYYAQLPGGAPADTQNMKDSLWQVNVPLGATKARVTGTWTPSLSLSPKQELMFHAGTTTTMGTLVGSIAHGTSPLATEWVVVPASATTLVVMCHVYADPDQPVGAEYQQTTHLRVEFI